MRLKAGHLSPGLRQTSIAFSKKLEIKHDAEAVRVRQYHAVQAEQQLLADLNQAFLVQHANTGDCKAS